MMCINLFTQQHSWSLFILLFIATILPAPLLAADDVVIMKNGDRITGTVKKLNNGNLEIDPPYTGTNFIVEWKNVERIESTANFIVQTSDGDYVTGSVRTDPDETGLSKAGR
jgi:hypothetical protein